MKKILITTTLFCAFLLSIPAFSQTWSQQNSSTTEDLNSCLFVTKTKGWAIGNSGVILYTENGGNTWTSQQSNTTSDLFGIYFLDSLKGYIVGRCATVLKTVNGGTTWTIQHEDPVSFCNSNPYDHVLNTIVMQDETTGTAAGCSGIGAIYTTNSFTNSTTPWYANFVKLQKVPYVNKIFTCTGQNIKTSDDYGYSWNTAGNYTSNLGTLSFGYYIDANNVFVCNKLEIFKYEWTGSTYAWVAKYTSTTFYINALIFRNQQKGYFCTSTGKIYYTGTSGQNWTLQETYITTPLKDIFFFNDTIGYSVGNSGVILKYENSPTTNVLSYKNDDSGIIIYPQPSLIGNEIRLRAKKPIEYIKLYDIYGKKVNFETVKYDNETIIKINHKGIYIIELLIDNNVIKRKLIIN